MPVIDHRRTPDPRAYLVFNTIMNLTSQEAQLASFENVAAHLPPGGCFVVEVMQPQLHRLPPGPRVEPTYYESATCFRLDEYDVANQRLVSHHFAEREGKLGSRSIPFRYVWPSELDLMARIAGMQRRARRGGWKREAFTSESEMLVGVWEKVAEPLA